jgi:hypothetical protein
MALQRMILKPHKLWVIRCQLQSPPPVKTILKSKNHSYNKWTRVRLHQERYLKNGELKLEPIPIPIIETTRKRGPFNTKPELETNSQPVHSNYIHDVFRRKFSHDPTICCVPKSN